MSCLLGHEGHAHICLPSALSLHPAPCPHPQKLADGGRLGETWAKTLNAGLVAAAVGHLAGKAAAAEGSAQGGAGAAGLANFNARWLH